MSVEEDRERLSQGQTLNWMQRDLQTNEMIPVYLSERNAQHNYGLYCALIPSGQIEQILSKPAWNLFHGQGLPGTVEQCKDDEWQIEYLRFGTLSGIEPLVIDRDFFGIRECYKEISEEFRLFHRLFHDRKQNCYIKIDDDGNEDMVAVVEANQIQIRLKEILQS